MDTELPRLFTVNEVARYLRLSKSQVYTLIQRNEIPHFRVSERRIVVSESDLITWIQKQKGWPQANWFICWIGYWKSGNWAHITPMRKTLRIDSKLFLLSLSNTRRSFALSSSDTSIARGALRLRISPVRQPLFRQRL